MQGVKKTKSNFEGKLCSKNKITRMSEKIEIKKIKKITAKMLKMVKNFKKSI